MPGLGTGSKLLSSCTPAREFRRSAQAQRVWGPCCSGRSPHPSPSDRLPGRRSASRGSLCQVVRADLMNWNPFRAVPQRADCERQLGAVAKALVPGGCSRPGGTQVVG